MTLLYPKFQLLLADGDREFTRFYKSGGEFATIQFSPDLVEGVGELGQSGGNGRLIGGQYVAPKVVRTQCQASHTL